MPYLKNAAFAVLTCTVFMLAAAAASLSAAPPDALERWLPVLNATFTPWGLHGASYGGRRDAFVCGPAHTSAAGPGASDFDYPAAACPVLQSGTIFNFGSGEPRRTQIVYDPAHRIALYSSGCCAERYYVLAAGVKPPPSAVRQADLSGVVTARGISLGASLSDVIRAYGKAVPMTLTDAAGSHVAVLAYTTFTSDPVHSSQACGQYQTFAFRQDKVALIELYVGC